MPNESTLTVSTRRKTHPTAIIIQNVTSVFTGQIVRASKAIGILTVLPRIERELQLHLLKVRNSPYIVTKHLVL